MEYTISAELNRRRVGVGSAKCPLLSGSLIFYIRLIPMPRGSFGAASGTSMGLR
jgi:hypothetical protein